MAADLPPIRLPERLTDGVIVLDSHTVADAETHSAGEDEEMLRRFDSPRRPTLDETRAAMQRFIDHRADGSDFTYALRLDGQLIGGCATYRLTPTRANVSYWLFPAFRGRGHAARAVTLLCDAFVAMGDLDALEAHIDPDNAPSIAVARRCGFVEAGTVEDTAWTGETSTRLLFVRPAEHPPRPGVTFPMAEGSTRVVYIALAANLGIAVVKLGAFALTRSSAMLTEAVHSLVDTLDQVFLLVGLKKAAKPADAAHPFGHGMEAYFWSFAVALTIFAVGGAASIWTGFHSILHPHPLERPWINYLVLAAAAAFEGASFVVSYREFRRIAHDTRVSLMAFVRLSKDPSLVSTLLEDGAALIGLAIAAAGVTGSAELGWTWADGAASVLIGLLLSAVAAFLAFEVHSLIVGEAAAPRVVAEMRRIIDTDPRVARLDEVLSLMLGPQNILVAITVDFHDALTAGEVQQATWDLSDRLQASDPRICRLFLRPAMRADAPLD